MSEKMKAQYAEVVKNIERISEWGRRNTPETPVPVWLAGLRTCWLLIHRLKHVLSSFHCSVNSAQTAREPRIPLFYFILGVLEGKNSLGSSFRTCWRHLW